MQTFLPYPSFRDSAAALDPARLGKQRVETLQLLRANTVPGYGWRHHPAAKMWAGRLPALVAYGLAMTDAWTALGRADSVRAQLLEFAPEVDGLPPDSGRYRVVIEIDGRETKRVNVDLGKSVYLGRIDLAA